MAPTDGLLGPDLSAASAELAFCQISSLSAALMHCEGGRRVLLADVEPW